MMVRSQGLPFIDGQPVAEGYGVLIARTRADDDDEFILARVRAMQPTRIIPPAPLVAWLTKPNALGVYEKVRRLSPEVQVSGWSVSGCAFTFEGGMLTLKEVRDG